MRRGEASRGSIPPRYVSPRRLSLTILLDVFLVSSLAAQSALNALPGSTRSAGLRSEEHTSELQSRLHLVCRLLLEKKKKNMNTAKNTTDSYAVRCRAS